MKTVISTPFPAPTETAAEFGVTEERGRRLARLMDAIREGQDVDAFIRLPAFGRRVYKATKKKKVVVGGRRRARKA